MKKQAAALLLAMPLVGCGGISTVQIYELARDYNIMAKGEAVFNSQSGTQFLIPTPNASNGDRLLVCSTSAGLFADKSEAPLREAGNEYLTDFKPGARILSSEDKSGSWDGRTCFEFTYAQQQPIGAYLDEETGEVVVVGESG